MEKSYKKIVIIGLGLIGGSLGLAFRNKKGSAQVIGLDRDQDQLKAALRLGAIDQAESDLEQAVEGADIIILATPIGQFRPIGEALRSYLKPQMILTDVGSVKGPIVEAFDEILFPSGRFVGGHPITGREQSGVGAATADLFAGARCILTPGPKTDQKDVQEIQGLWESIGSEVALMSPSRHDQIFSVVSHLPHVTTYALINLVLSLDATDGELLDYSAGGLRDFTRIAASSPEMWRDICMMNGDQIVNQMDAYINELQDIKKLIMNKNSTELQERFSKARTIRKKLTGTD